LNIVTAFDICCVVVAFAASASAQIFSTVGVYDAGNGVNFVATGSTVNFIQFKTDVAVAFSNDFGGVNQCYAIGQDSGPYIFSYGASQTKLLNMTSGTGNVIGITASSQFVQAISGNDLWVSEEPEMTFFLGSITSSVPNEAVVEFGLTILSTSYYSAGEVTATARFSGGGEASASRSITEDAGLGNTFFGFAAPSGQSIVSITFTNSSGQNMNFDDIGFITSAIPPALSILRIGISQARTSWPTNAVGFTLEFTTSLATPMWTADTNTQTVIGDQLTVTTDSTIGQRYYRLRKP
jgi:hypothetical protein